MAPQQDPPGVLLPAPTHMVPTCYRAWELQGVGGGWGRHQSLEWLAGQGQVGEGLLVPGALGLCQ